LGKELRQCGFDVQFTAVDEQPASVPDASKKGAYPDMKLPQRSL